MFNGTCFKTLSKRHSGLNDVGSLLLRGAALGSLRPGVLSVIPGLTRNLYRF